MKNDMFSHHVMMPSLCCLIALFVLWPTLAVAQQSATPQPPTVQERVEVVATRTLEPAVEVPAPIEVFTAQELIDRGARDLESALALATGVTIAPGGDGGPASSVGHAPVGAASAAAPKHGAWLVIAIRTAVDAWT